MASAVHAQADAIKERADGQAELKQWLVRQGRDRVQDLAYAFTSTEEAAALGVPQLAY